jgi:hypothetical protein
MPVVSKSRTATGTSEIDRPRSPVIDVSGYQADYTVSVGVRQEGHAIA